MALLSRARNWSADTIRDETYRTKFINLPNIIADWTRDYGGISGRDILDFGCGEGTTAIGMALQHAPRRVVGVEIQPEMDRCLPLAREQLGLEDLPENLHLYRIKPGFLHDPYDRFDLIYSWSVFEHIEHRLLPSVLDLLRGALKPEGLLFIQVTPLFYSSEGSHMKRWVPEPWGHLLNQHNDFCDKLRSACRDQAEFESLWSTYRTLNRLTAPELVELVRGAGFEILRDYRTQDECQPSARLKQIFHNDILITNQIVLLLRLLRS